MNAQWKLLLALSTQIVIILKAVLHARVWKDFLDMVAMVAFAMVRKV